MVKILTKEEEDAHYSATLKGGIGGGLAGLAIGSTAVFAASKRFHGFRQLTLPMKAFLATSSGTFAAIVSADRASRKFEWDRDPSRKYKDKTAVALEEAQASESTFDRLKEWGRINRYPLVTAGWVASMGISLGLVGRDKYLTKAQKLVQARMYAQGFTLALLIVTAVLETSDASQGKGRWETVKVLDPNDPEHKHMIEKKIHLESYAGEDLWRDMVEAEERRLKERDEAVKAQEVKDKSGKPNQQAKGTENKNKIVSESKSAGSNVNHEEAQKKEEANMAKQEEKETDAQNSAVADDAKVTDRGGYGGK